MKHLFLTFAACIMFVPMVQAQGLEARLNTLVEEACVNGNAYEHHGIKLGMSEAELQKLGAEAVQVNRPSSGSSSVKVAEKVFVIWNTPKSPDAPRYRIDYAHGTTSPLTVEDATRFTEDLIKVMGEPKLKGEGASYLSAGYPTLNYSAVSSISGEKFSAIDACLRPKREISPHEKMALERFTARNFKSAFDGLKTHCPDHVDAYFDYMAYSLQPEVNVATSKTGFNVNMRCPAYDKVKAILAAE